MNNSAFGVRGNPARNPAAFSFCRDQANGGAKVEGKSEASGSTEALSYGALPWALSVW